MRLIILIKKYKSTYFPTLSPDKVFYLWYGNQPDDDMKRTGIILMLVATAALLFSCAREDRFSVVYYNQETKTIFNISVASNTKTKTKSQDNKNTKSDPESKGADDGTKNVSDYSTKKNDAYLDSKIAFGLVGVDNWDKTVLVDNQPVYETDGIRTASLFTTSLSSGSMQVSAHYPYASSVNYRKDGSYSISFTPNDIKKGPLASNTVNMRCDQELEMVSLQFHHISNSIGFEVCDITDDEQLKGLMSVRKVILHGMPTEGLFVVEGDNSRWVPNAKHQNIVIYEGNDSVRCGVENSSFMAADRLSDDRADCNHVYVVPEEFKEGKHYVEVIFDVAPFDYDGTHYRGAKGQSQIIQLAGVIPNDQMELGLQYTFVLGMNIYTVYRPIEFSASINDWEVKFNGRVLDFDNE